MIIVTIAIWIDFQVSFFFYFSEQGRHIEVFELNKPPCGGLGFSVVGLRSDNRGELGIFVQEIQEGSVAHR